MKKSGNDTPHARADHFSSKYALNYNVILSRLVFTVVSAFVFCLLVPGKGFTDEVRLKNGDRITGRVLNKENGTVAVKTEYAGTIAIKWNEIAHITTEQPVAVYLKDKTLKKVSEIYAGRPEENGGKAAVPEAEILYVNPPPYLTGAGVLWSGRLDAGYWANDGNSPAKRLSLDALVGARTKDERYTLTGGYLFVEDNGVETESKSSGSAKIDHFFNPKWYGTGQLKLKKDRAQGIDLRTIVGGGPGHQFWESRNLNLSVESGIDYVMVDNASGPDEEYPAFRWGLDFDKFIIEKRLQAFHNHQLNISMKNTQAILFSSKTGLRMPFMENVIATIETDYDWDSQPTDDKKRGDTTYKFSLGYSW